MSQDIEKERIKYTQAEMDDCTVSEFLNPKFVGLLMQKFPDAKVINISINMGRDNGVLFHLNQKAFDEKRTAIDGSSPEIFEKLLQVVTEFKKG